MKSLFQSIGIVFTILIIGLLALISLYISYLVALGVLIIGLVWIIYQLISLFNEQTFSDSKNENK